MARVLTFLIKKKEYQVEAIKVDRRKLYGWTEIEATDDQGDVCKLASTDETGTLIIPMGGTALGIVNQKGLWVERAELKAVDDMGKPAELHTSSYEVKNTLKDKVTSEQFLDYSITDFYELENADNKALMTAIGKDIYTFPYSYLDSYEQNTAFLMVSESSSFMLVGYKNVFEPLCLGDCGLPSNDNDEDEDESGDSLDFSMFY